MITSIVKIVVIEVLIERVSDCEQPKASQNELINMGYGLKLIEPYKDAETATGRDIIKYLNF